MRWSREAKSRDREQTVTEGREGNMKRRVWRRTSSNGREGGREGETDAEERAGTGGEERAGTGTESGQDRAPERQMHSGFQSSAPLLLGRPVLGRPLTNPASGPSPMKWG